MSLRAVRIVLACAALALAWPAAAADAPRPDTPQTTPQKLNQGLDCANSTAPRDPLANPEARRGAMDEQFCTQLDRTPTGQSLELYGGTIDGGQRRTDPALTRARDEIDHQDGFFGLR